MSNCHLILGGARSGKSLFSEKTAQAAFKQLPNDEGSNRKLIYLATATADDQEMESRIVHHQQRRGQEWQLIEEPLDIAFVIKRATRETVILIDCLTLWLSNCLHQQCWTEKRADLLESISNCDATVIMVSNEVGSGIVPMGELSRQFVDESGWLHQKIAEIVPNVTLVVAGLEMPLKRLSQ